MQMQQPGGRHLFMPVTSDQSEQTGLFLGEGGGDLKRQGPLARGGTEVMQQWPMWEKSFFFLTLKHAIRFLVIILNKSMSVLKSWQEILLD